MRARFLIPSLIALAVLPGGCAGGQATAGRLAPRAAEAIDPRNPIPADEVARPASAALTAQLARLTGDAAASTGSFDTLSATARNAATGAGPAQSESWIDAQVKLSAAIKARAPVAKALADIDGLGAVALANRGGLSVGDRLAIAAAAEEVAAIDRRQAESVSAIAAMLAR
ncbi:MAG: hypothetical protein ABIR51_08115 [Sphingomicrobium sp.]